MASAFWRKLDAPGHDTCRLVRQSSGWRLEGVAVFSRERTPVSLLYDVSCDAAWRTRSGQVRGRFGDTALAFDITRTNAGVWTLNGKAAANLEGCIDLDFGFTPATNLFQLQRMNLAVGQAADVPVAWLDVSSVALERIKQRYERRSTFTYWYESPSFQYAAMLEVDASGFVRSYPGLWEAEQ
jgi:uncharacterized protein